MKKNKYLFSIIMPIYNAADYLDDSIGSILSQNNTNYELILMNDGSTDDSLKVIEKYEKMHDNIRVISRDNKGILKTRLDGVEAANGEYILFVDADDALSPDALNIYEKYLKNKKYDIIRGNYELITNKGRVKTIEFNKLIQINRKNFAKEVYFKYLTGPKFNSIWRTLIKKELLCLYADIKISMGEDQALMISILKKSNNILLIPDIVYQYRINNSSTTNLKNIDKKCKNYIELYDLYYKIIIPFFKEFGEEKLLNLAYSKYLRDMNMLFYEIYKIDNKGTILFEYQEKLFNSEITKELREHITKRDIKNQKTYYFLKPILDNNKKKHLSRLKLLKIIKR